MCRHGENIYNLSFVANRRISERRVLPSDNGKAQKPRFPTLFLGILRQKSRTFLCGMLAPQVGLEPTTLRLTAVCLCSIEKQFLLLYVMQNYSAVCAEACAVFQH